MALPSVGTIARRVSAPFGRTWRKLRQAQRRTRKALRHWRAGRTGDALTRLLGSHPAPRRPLPQEYLKRCQVIESRNAMLELLPKGAVCAELGVMRGDFSERILEVTQPRTLHLIDINPKVVERVRERFRRQVDEGIVCVHLGDSADTLLGLPTSLDWIYIDGDHLYPGVCRDLEAARQKVRPDGMIALDDYMHFNTVEFKFYGVVSAVNDFCIKHDWEPRALALDPAMHCNVLLQRRPPPES